MQIALRVLIVLVALPAALLWLAWRLAQLHGQPPAEAAAASAPAMPAVDAVAQQATLDALQDTLRHRREHASRCVAHGLRVADADLRESRLMLVVATSTGCSRGCEAERIAEHLNDSYTMEGLRVLVLRTADDGRMDTPMGVSTVVVPECAPLFETHGHDYFLRHPDGRLSSSGERHEAALLQEIELGFDPEPLVRRHLNLRN